MGGGLRFSRNDRTVEVIKLFIIWHGFFNDFLLCFCKPVIGLWTLRENNALQFNDNWPIRARVISPTNTSHTIKNWYEPVDIVKLNVLYN